MIVLADQIDDCQKSQQGRSERSRADSEEGAEQIRDQERTTSEKRHQNQGSIYEKLNQKTGA